MSVTAPDLGVVVTTSEAPPVNGVPTNTATAFVIGRADQGPANRYQLVNSITQFASVYGPRSATNATLYDSLDAMFHIGVRSAYIGRVVGPSPVNATLTLNDSGTHPTVIVTADTPGSNGNGLYVAVAVTGGNFVFTLQDSAGNVIAQSPSLSSQAALLAWAATIPDVAITAATGGSSTTNNPAAITATPLVGGTDDFTDATLTQWQNALNLFPFTLGPGQVLAPGQTNTTLNGIWAALLFHAYTNNRFACMDLDSASPSALISAIAAFNNAYYASWGMFDQPTALIPGVVANTLRTVPASAVRAGLCAMVDATGNPNQAAAGWKFPIPYVVGFNWYGGAQNLDSDVLLMNQAGVNTFENRYGRLESYGFSTPVPQNGNVTDPDAIYWQASRSRLRMALVAEGYAVGEPFVFSQIDGAGVDINAFGTAISSMLLGYGPPPAGNGALYGATAADAFTVNVGPSVNTPTTIAAGELKAAVAYRPSPFAEMVELDLSAVPTTQTLP